MANKVWGTLPDVLQEVVRLAGRSVIDHYFIAELQDLAILGDFWLDHVKDEADLDKCGLFRANVTYGTDRLFNNSASTPCVSIVNSWAHYSDDMTHDEAVQKMKVTLIGLVPDAITALALLGDSCAD